MGPFAATAATAAFQMIQARQQAKAQNAVAAAQAQSQVQQIQRRQEIRDRQRREQLKRTLATQRARFASRGVGRGGSAQAVLDGLAKETDQVIAEERSLNAFPIGRINEALDKRRRSNLLEASDIRRRLAFDLLGRGFKQFSLLD